MAHRQQQQQQPTPEDLAGALYDRGMAERFGVEEVEVEGAHVGFEMEEDPRAVFWYAVGCGLFALFLVLLALYVFTK